MSRPAEDDPRVVELVDPLNDELIKQRRGGRALVAHVDRGLRLVVPAGRDGWIYPTWLIQTFAPDDEG